MAVIGRIRKRVGLVIGLVGMSLVLFVLGDLVTSNKGLMGGSTDVLGVVRGEKIRYPEFEKRVEQMIENYKINSKTESVDNNTTDMLREQAWTTVIKETIMKDEYANLGVTCGPEELFDMCTGKNVHAQIKQAFTDPKTGQFNPQDVVKFLKKLDEQPEATQKQWKQFEDAIKDERIDNKWKDVIKGGLYTTTAEGKQNYIDNGRMASVKILRLDYATIVDSAAIVDDNDLKKYYNEHPNDYKQAETIRKMEYITFDVSPSDNDKESAMKWINDRKEEFAKSTEPILFVNQNSDTPMDSTFHAAGSLKPAIDTVAFTSDTNTVIGPFIEANSWKLARVTATKMVCDSVKARHILIKIENNDTTAAMNKADSLKKAIKKGEKFDALASKYSADPGSAIKGGDLGWFKAGMMVPTFNDACFNGKKGDMPIVTSQFGIHFIEIMEKSKESKQIQVAVVEHKVESSQKTFDNWYAKANEFAAVNTTKELFDSACIKQGLNKRIADNVKENDKTIAGLDSPREMVRWSYKAKVGEVSKVFTLGDKYVVATLVDMKEKGTLPLDAVKEQVTASAKKEKKALMLTEKYNTTATGATNIDDAAKKMNLPLSPAENVAFGNGYIAGIGNEPTLVGNIFAMKPGQLSKPIKGLNGVFIFSIDKFTEPAVVKDYVSQQSQISSALKNRADYEVFNALKEKANVEDNRGKFY